MMKILLALVVLLALGGGYYWYTQNAAAPAETEMNDPFGSADTRAVEAPPSMPADAVMEDGTLPESGEMTDTGTGTESDETDAAVAEFTVTSSGMTFTPKELTVKQGTRVRITYENGGGTHDFRIDEFGVRTDVISGGESETVEFVATESGEFEYYCSVGNHRAMGMWGTLTVTE